MLKANLHTHSTTSDGRFTPDEVIALYSAQKYDVMAFTDHRKTNLVSALDGKGMTLISGIEMHPQGAREILWHLLALGVPESFSDCSELAAQAVVDRVNRAGGLCFVAHPYWCGLRSQEVMTLNGIMGIEVYNTSTRYIGKEYNMVIWDEILDSGCKCTALAVDDIHHPCDLFKGWTMVAASERTPDAVLAALRTGRFYATQGPKFHRLSFKDGIFEAEFTSCRSAVIVSNQCNGFCGAVPDPNGPNTTKKGITAIHFDVSTLPAGSYLRCQICDKNGKYAWSNPIII